MPRLAVLQAVPTAPCGQGAARHGALSNGVFPRGKRESRHHTGDSDHQRRLPTPRALSRSQAFRVYVVPESTAGTVRSQEALSFQEAPLHHPPLTCQAFAPRNLSEAAASRPPCSRDEQALPGPARL